MMLGKHARLGVLACCCAQAVSPKRRVGPTDSVSESVSDGKGSLGA